MSEISETEFLSKTGDQTREPQPRHVIEFNGASQSVVCGTDPFRFISDNLSVVVWAKNNNSLLNTKEVLISNFQDGIGGNWELFINSSEKISVIFGSSVGGEIQAVWESTNAITINAINQICFTFSGGNLKVYLNSVEIAGSVITGSIPSAIEDIAEPMHIASNANGGNWWEGTIYEARIYDTTILTAEEVAAIYEDPISHDAVGANLVALYKLDESSGSIAYDSSGNENHGDYINNPNWTTSSESHSWHNQVGYTKSGNVFVPRNESVITQDVLGSALQYDGKVAFNAKLKESNCIELNGSSQYGDFNNNSSPLIAGSANFDIECYVSVGSLPQSVASIVLSQYIASANNNRMITGITPTGECRIFVGEGSGYSGVFLTSLTKLNLNTIYKLNFRKEGAVFSIYINDNLDITHTDPDANRPMLQCGNLFGARSLSGANYDSNVGAYFDGLLFGLKVTYDGTVVAQLPLSEGLLSTSYDTSGNDNNITWINNPNWSTQDNYHYNINNGFEHYDDDATGLNVLRIPFLTNGSQITPVISGYAKNSNNPQVYGHNNSETKFDFVYIAEGNTVPPELNWAVGDSALEDFVFDTNWDSYNQAFYRQLSNTANDRFLIYQENITGATLNNALSYTS